MSESQAVAAGTGTPAGQSGTKPASSTGRRPAMLVFHWALAAFLLLLAVQIFLAGLGAFRTEAVGADSAFAPHRDFGFALGGVALVILVLAVADRGGRGGPTWARGLVGA